MTNWGRRLLSIAFSFMFLFISVGYAALADTMTVTGTASWVFEGVYISSIELVSDGTSGVTSSEQNRVFPTNLANTVTITAGSNNTRTVKYKITVKNTSYRYTFSYKGIVCDTGLSGYNNSYFSTKTANDKFTVKTTKLDGSEYKVDTPILPEATDTFYATYTFGKNMSRNTPMKFLLNYKYSINVASMGEAAVERTMATFLNVLNATEDYQTLIVNIDNKYNNADWQANYIGNVSQAGSGTASATAKADAEIVEGLLGSGLTLTVDGVTKNVTVLIKRENVDGNERTGDAYKATNGGNTTTGKGCEMTIYMTPNNLDKKVDDGEYSGDGGEWNGKGKWAEVFVSISTCTNNGVIDNATGNYTSMGEWYQIGDIYEGIANIVTYEGGNGNGSFVTDNWKSLQKTYKVTEKYSYTIAADRKLSSIVADTDTNANNEFTRLKNLANEAITYIEVNSDYFKASDFAEAITALRTASEKANNMSVNNRTTRVTLIPILKELERAVYPFQSYLNQN